MEMRFQEAAAQFLSGGAKLKPFFPFPRAEERAAFEELPDALKERLILEGRRWQGYSWPSIHATDYMAFSRTGNRVNFENIYFGRRTALNSLALAECVEGEGRFLDEIVNGIFALCEESAWQLPAHNSYARGAPQEPLPDSSRPVLDLFACETGAQLACIHYLLKERLDEISPFISQRISRELERRIIAPYLKEHFWWMGSGEEPMCNWTPWCTQNILLAAFLHPWPEDTRRQILQKASFSCDCFLKDYEDDGCCDEGAQYFRRAGLCLDAACDLMDQVTGGAFRHLYQWEKIRNIAAYIANVHVDGKYYFNFADCSPVAGRCGVREFLFGKRTNQPELMLFAAKDYQAANEEIYQEEIYRLNLYYRLWNAFTYAQLMACDSSPPLRRRDIFYPSIGLFIARSRSFSLAVKAGDNDDNHNHNDTGSITLYKNGEPLLADIGVESYTRRTFSSQRYEIWTMQSGYHNLPSIEGMDQRDGPRYRALDVHTDLTEKHALISMDLAGAYPLSEPGRFYTREVILHKDQDRTTLTDTTNCGNVILNFIVSRKPEISENRIYTAGAVMEFNGGQLLTVETLAITDERLRTAWDHDLYRIRLFMTDRIFKLNIE